MNYKLMFEIHSAICDLNKIVKEHLTDGSGKTLANFQPVDKALKEILYIVNKEKLAEDKRQEAFENKVMGDQFEDR